MATPQRLPWLYTEYPIYFLTMCTHNRRQILARHAMHETFIEFSKASPAHGVWVGRYVLMPDHLHVFVRLGPFSIPLSRWVKSLKNAMSKVFNALHYPAPHWQRGYFDHVIRSEESYDEKWQYVRANPVRGGFVDKPEDWPFAGEIHELL